jgi:hypothetical protein
MLAAESRSGIPDPGDGDWGLMRVGRCPRPVHSKPLVLGAARTELDRELLRAYQAVRGWD